MSKRAKTPHLVLAKGIGFQYHLVLPKALNVHPELPKSIRWSLGQHYETALHLANILNCGFDRLFEQAHRHGFSVQQILQQLEELRQSNLRALNHIDLPLGSLPAPHQLASQALSSGYHTLKIQQELNPVLFEKDGEWHVALRNDDGYGFNELIRFKRFDIALNTSDPERAAWKVAYLYEALHLIKSWRGDGYLYASAPLQSMAIAFKQYVDYVARPSKHVSPLEQRLPTTVNEVIARAPWPEASMDSYRYLDLIQTATGEYCLHIHDVTSKFEPQRIPLKTTNWPLAFLLLVEVAPELAKLLEAFPYIHPQGKRALNQLLKQIKELLNKYLEGLPEPKPLPDLPRPGDAGGSSSALAPYQSKNLLRFGEVVERFKQYQRACNVWSNPDAELQALARLAALVEIVGPDYPVTEIHRPDIVRVRDLLRVYPAGRNRHPALKHRPLREILDESGYALMQPGTAKRYFTSLKQVFAFALDQGFIEQDPAASVLFKVTGSPKANRTYNHPQIQALLNGPALTRKEPPNWRLDDYKFWLPLLGLFLGARLNELCQLTLGDVREEMGILYLSLNTDQPGKRLKNLSSHRDIPLHPILLDMGFADFVAKRRNEVGNNPDAQLFAGLNIIRTKLPGAYASKWYRGDSAANKGYLHICNLGGLGLTFHGLRHTFINNFRVQKLDMKICQALVGHADPTTTGRYGRGYPLDVLYGELAKLDYKIDCSHIHYSNYLALQQMQGRYSRGRPSGQGQRRTSTSSHWRRHLAAELLGRHNND